MVIVSRPGLRVGFSGSAVRPLTGSAVCSVSEAWWPVRGDAWGVRAGQAMMGGAWVLRHRAVNASRQGQWVGIRSRVRRAWSTTLAGIVIKCSRRVAARAFAAACGVIEQGVAWLPRCGRVGA